MSELKPCPFCGGEAHIVQWSNKYDAVCQNRECDVFLDCYASYEQAVNAWNTRTPDTTALLKQALEALESLKANRDEDWPWGYNAKMLMDAETVVADKAITAIKQHLEGK